MHPLDGGVLVVDCSLFGVNDDGAVVGGNEVVVAIGFEGADCAVELPRGGGAGWIVVLPRDVYLEQGGVVFGERLLAAGEAHCLADVVKDCFG